MFKQIFVKRYECKCERCGHKWIPKKGLPKSCASCKSRSWPKPRISSWDIKNKK